MEPPKIVFVTLPNPSQYFGHHLGIAYIQAFLKKKGIKSFYYVPRKSISFNELIDELLSHGTKTFGFASYENNYYYLRTVIAELKKRDENVKIIVGGPTPTFSYKLMLKADPIIDVCVRFEGEQTTYELLTKWETKDDLKKIKGISFINGEEIITTPNRELLKGDDYSSELDFFPSPYIEGILDGTVKVGIITSRGCFHKCVYCNYAAMNKRTIRFHSIPRVVQELKIIYNNIKDRENYENLKDVRLWDDAFSLNKERAKEICKRIIKEEIDLNLITEMRAETTDKELLTLMKRAGFYRLNFGLESAVPRVLREIKKISDSRNRQNYGPEQFFLTKVKENVRSAQEMGFFVSVSILTGLPGETFEDAERTINFVKELNVPMYSHNILHIVPGTEVYETYKNYGIDIFRSKNNPIEVNVQYAYNPFEVTILDNSHLKYDTNSFLEEMAKLFSTGDFSNEEANKFTSLLILNLDKLPSQPCLDWIKHNSSFNSRIGIDMGQGDLFNDSVNCLKNKRVPSYFFFEINKNRKQIKITPRGSKEFGYHSKTFLRQNFKEYLNDESSLESDTTLLLELLEKDKGFFMKFVKDLTNNQINKMPSRLCKNSVKILNQCMWCDVSCVKTCIRKIEITNKGDIKCCFNKKGTLSHINNNKSLTEIITKLSIKKQEERGCASCKVKDICSKCLFPDPFTDEEYCNIRRSNISLSEDFGIIERIKEFSS